jgi:hypothetical protein
MAWCKGGVVEGNSIELDFLVPGWWEGSHTVRLGQVAHPAESGLNCENPTPEGNPDVCTIQCGFRGEPDP